MKVFFTIFISLLIFSSVTSLKNSIQSEIKNNSKILTTEKDFVRLKNEDKKNIKFTKISLEIIEIEKLKEKLKIKNEVN